MDALSCPECRAIFREMREVAAAARLRLRDLGRRQPDLADWVRAYDAEEGRALRELSPFWEPWRRWQEHRALTGHSIALLSLPPDSLTNPN